jgi:hypothetical protein
MLRHPDAAIAPVLGVDCEIPGIVERAARIGIFSDADELEEWTVPSWIAPGLGRL